MTVPTAPIEAGGSKIIFASYDGGGSNAAAILRAYQVATLNSTVHGDLGVYPTSGLPATGYKATATGAAIAIAGSVPCQGVLVMADPDNTEDIWVGASTITASKAATDGYRLAAGQSVGIACRNLNTVFILRGAATNQGVYYSASKD